MHSGQTRNRKRVIKDRTGSHASEYYTEAQPLVVPGLRQVGRRSFDARCYRIARIFFALTGMSYLAFLIGSIAYSSSVTYPLEKEFDRDSEKIAGASSDGPVVYIRDFHRLEMKDGKPAWEVKGNDAEHTPKAGLTVIRNARVTFYGKGGAKSLLSAKEARLQSQGTALERAYLEGDVLFETGSGIIVESNSGLFEKKDSQGVDGDQIEAFGDCQITGKGFEIKGDSLVFKVQEEEMRVYRNVRSRFVLREVEGRQIKSLEKFR